MTSVAPSPGDLRVSESLIILSYETWQVDSIKKFKKRGMRGILKAGEEFQMVPTSFKAGTTIVDC